MPLERPSHGVRRLLLSFVALAAAACGDGGTGPAEPGLRLEVVGGDGQSGFGEELLPAPVTVRVVEVSGGVRARVPVHFEVVAGGGQLLDGSAQSDASGVASVRWRLGPAGTRVQRLRAWVEGGEDAVEVTATALDPGEADVVVVHGASGPLRGVLLMRPFPSGGVEIVQSIVSPDTVVRLRPTQGPADVVVFAGAERPLLESVAWTEAPDTAHVTLLPSVAVDVVFDIRAGDPQQQRSTMQAQLDATERIWEREGMGLRLGEVTFLDNTAEPGLVDVSSSGLCSGGGLGDAVLVTLVATIDGGRYDGWGCWSGRVYLSLGTYRHPNLLAHELGHTFTLLHTATGMMYPNSPGTDVRDGETFRAHFHVSSVLNTIFASQPVQTRRACHPDPRTSPCLPEDFDVGPGAVAVAASGPGVEEGRPVDGVGETRR